MKDVAKHGTPDRDTICMEHAHKRHRTWVLVLIAVLYTLRTIEAPDTLCSKARPAEQRPTRRRGWPGTVYFVEQVRMCWDAASRLISTHQKWHDHLERMHIDRERFENLRLWDRE